MLEIDRIKCRLRQILGAVPRREMLLERPRLDDLGNETGNMETLGQTMGFWIDGASSSKLAASIPGVLVQGGAPRFMILNEADGPRPMPGDYLVDEKEYKVNAVRDVYGILWILELEV